MNQWQSGEECQNLEHLIIKTSSVNHRNEVLDANGVKHIGATKKPPAHTLPVVCKSGFVPYTDPIISQSYVVRKKDNRVASVSFYSESFYFGVWKETEEEFLRMVT